MPEDVLPTVATGHDVAEGTGDVEAHAARRPAGLRQTERGCQDLLPDHLSDLLAFN